MKPERTKPVCDRDCFRCRYADCVLDDATPYEVAQSEHRDRKTDKPIRHKSEASKAYNRRYYREHREAMTALSRKYYAEHREEIAEQKHQWYLRNRERILAQQREYKARKKKSNGTMSIDD